MPTRRKPTPNDKAVLEAIQDLQVRDNEQPSRGAIARAVGLHKGTVVTCLLRLKKFGLVTWEPNVRHSIRLAA